MTETATDPDMTETATDQDDESNDTDESTETALPEKMTAYLLWGTVAVLFLVGVVAFVGLYRSVGSIIDIWIAPDFQPLVRAAFNLTVVLVCALGLSVLLGRIDTDRFR